MMGNVKNLNKNTWEKKCNKMQNYQNIVEATQMPRSNIN